MNDVLDRLLAPVLDRALRSAPVVVVSGARQTGKSTLVEALTGRRYVTLDDLDDLDRAQRAPEALLRGSEPITIDEVQRAPKLLHAIKRAVDRRLNDLLAWAGAQVDPPTIQYWRTAAGDEVDFIVESQQGLLPIEVKTSTRARIDDARGLAAFHAEHGRRSRAGLLLHDGSKVEWLTDRVLAAPWWMVI